MGGSLAESYLGRIKPILEKNCFSCHNPKKDKGDIDLKSLPYKNIDEGSAEIWALGLDMINSGDMPPEKKPRLSKRDLMSTTKWIEEALKRTQEELRSEIGGEARVRRLNQTEYRNTIRDLTGHPFDAAELFTADTQSHGFDNVGGSLQFSPLHIEAYVAAAERVVSKIIDVPEKKPVRQHWKILNSTPPKKRMKRATGKWHDGHEGKPKKTIKKGRLKGNVLPNAEIPNGSTPYSMLDMTTSPPTPYAGSWDIRAFGGDHGDGGGASFGFKWFAYQEGIYRIKLNVDVIGPEKRGHGLQVFRYPEGPMWKQYTLFPGKRSLNYELYRDAIPWYVKVNGNRNWGLNLGYHFEAKNEKTQAPLGVHLSSIELEGPIYESWPPPYHRRIFHVRKEGQSDEVYAKEVLEIFMSRAFRQPVEEEEFNRMMSLYRKGIEDKLTFMEAMRLPLTTVLCSPKFLYLSGPGRNQTPAFSLASRLSYFLWRSMPDEELLRLAKSKALLRSYVLKKQIVRMLKDSRRSALVRNFTRQWLNLDKLKSLEADRKLYHPLNLRVKTSMIGESEAFFEHILDQKLPLRTFLDSDFVMVDNMMARLYGLKNVDGDHFRKVQLKPHNMRGGILAHGSVLTVTSNGIRTLPVDRGVFILENILGDPPSSPPPDVGQLEDVKIPKLDATIREKLELHRKDPTCARCHNKIDPLGFALENFNAIGQFRRHEMKYSEEKGKFKGALVDATGKLPNGKEFKSFGAFKKLILEKEDDFIHCFVEKMLIYALDRPMGFRDEDFVEKLVKEIKKEGATIDTVIEKIVMSKAFMDKA
jgi:hypothetical protein